MRSRGAVFAAAAGLGIIAGWALAQERYVHHRQDLFHQGPVRRLAALGYLAGQESVETVRLLRDYVAWEPLPLLRRRGEGILRKLEASLA